MIDHVEGTNWIKNPAGILAPPGTPLAPVVRAEFEVKVTGFSVPK